MATTSNLGKRKYALTASATTKKQKTTTKSTTTKPKAKRGKSANSGFGRGKKALENVHQLLSDLGVERVYEVSNCLKAGILKGSITLKRPQDDPEGQCGLDQVLVTGSCLVCGEEGMQCRIRDVLYQPDSGGMDYEDGGLDAPFKCTDEDCNLGIYITGMCSGSPSFDTGKFHNHCGVCPRFGVCLGDYREVHCDDCGGHYFAGGMGGECYNCERKGKKKGGRGVWQWMEMPDDF